MPHASSPACFRRVRDRTAFTALVLGRLLTLAAPALLPAGSAEAGRLHPALAARIGTMTAEEKVGAILILSDQARIDLLSRSLSAQRATRRDRHREVLLALQEAATRAQRPILEELDQLEAAGRVTGHRGYWIANLIVVHGEGPAIAALAARADVDQAEPNFEISLLSPAEVSATGPSLPAADGRGYRAGDGPGGRREGEGVPLGLRVIHADRVWYELGTTGESALVASLDTGVDGTHPALASRWRGRHTPWQHAWHDALGTGTTFPIDGHGHGTHVMGTITGLGVQTGDSIGVAPGAEWIAANACNQSAGREFDNDVINCYQWFADPDGNVNTVDDVPDVVNNSWGVRGLDYYDCDARWWVAMDNLEAAGTVLTYGAGNAGPGPMTVISPADRATTPLNSFSVGAINGLGTFPYPIAPFSSRGPSGCSGFPSKPELVAPGVGIYSCIPGGGYWDGWQGTSLAVPHVSGVVALMRSVDPDLEVDAIKQILLDTAVDLGAAGEDNDYGWGFPDAYAAVLSVIGSAATPGNGAETPARLWPSLPNPFAGSSTIRFTLTGSSRVRLAMFNVQGLLIRTLLDATRPAGTHVVRWDGRDAHGRVVPSGVYLIRLQTSGFVAERKLLRVG